MNVTQKRMTAIFNEWAKRYADNPDEYGSIIDDDGNPVADYGYICTRLFERLADEMDRDGLLPRPAAGLGDDKQNEVKK